MIGVSRDMEEKGQKARINNITATCMRRVDDMMLSHEAARKIAELIAFESLNIF